MPTAGLYRLWWFAVDAFHCALGEGIKRLCPFPHYLDFTISSIVAATGCQDPLGSGVRWTYDAITAPSGSRTDGGPAYGTSWPPYQLRWEDIAPSGNLNKYHGDSACSNFIGSGQYSVFIWYDESDGTINVEILETEGDGFAFFGSALASNLSDYSITINNEFTAFGNKVCSDGTTRYAICKDGSITLSWHE